MTKNRTAIACGLLLAIGFIGCTGDDGPSVSKGAGADAAAAKGGGQASDSKAKSGRPAGALD